ncbi:MAG: FG-GAP repeat protein [Chitinophagaceae bacterium]|nr:FG-GAP repeat protein [Chitinophagaceae bacterium]
MYKFFTLAAAVAIMPLSKQAPADLAFVSKKEKQAYIFPYKNSLPDPFKAETKPAEPWSQNWMATAQENIRKSEYHFVWEEKLKAYCTPNRKNNLRFFYDDRGFVVEPGRTKIPIGDIGKTTKPDEIKYRTIADWKVKFDLDKKQVGIGQWRVGENKAEYVSDKITVQYINNDEGMRQNFIVHAPLSNDDELKLNFSVKTKLKTYLHGNQLQFFRKKENVLNYEQLKVWDAEGKPLEAVIKKCKKSKYSIEVNTKYAAYPITIDPLSTTPNSTPDDANQAGAKFGCSVASAGDVNGDGYSDVIIGALDYDDGANLSEGRAFVYHGSATGLSASPISTPDDANLNLARFGCSVASAGDVNGDGYSDVIIGAFQYTDGANSNEGRAFVYHGSAIGIAASPNSNLDDANQAGACFGYSVASAGDVNGDGYSDVIIGAFQYNDGVNTDEGRAFVYHGSVTGLSASPNSTHDDANQASVFFGGSVASAGDVNGDGYSDVVIGASQYDDGGNTNEGRAFVYHGSATGLSTTPNSTLDDGNQLGTLFGCSVASAGDVNGDGYSDVIIGAYLYDLVALNTDFGRAFIYYGSAIGLSATPTSFGDASQTGEGVGISVACAGDINGDGYSDVILGAIGYDDGVNTNEGRAFVYYGASTGLVTTAGSTPDDSDQADSWFGYSVSSAGDVNGDGYSDVIIGAQYYDDGVNTNEGRAFVYHGSAAGLSTSPNNTQDDANQAGANFGYSVSLAGDVNADGYSDVIIGAFMYDDGANVDEGRAFVYHGSATGLAATPNNTQDDANQAGANFGVSVSTAGDLNGDGYSDVIIGANGFDDGANTAEGRAYVYHGSATGLGASPVSTPDDANQANANFGISVADAGDLNGDGFSDVIIGASGYDDGANTDEGRAFVYHGSATGLSANPNSTPDDANQASSSFGCSVASAGDVNGDGYSDVIIGAYQYDDGANANEGRAYVYHGSGSGISAFPSNTQDDANQAGACFGVAVSSAGDVNGDGYSDVIIGAYLYDDGANTDEGRAFIYHGSATGLSATPNNTQDDSNQAYANFGISVSTAGDVNGDGYSDVIIGASQYDDGANVNEGRAYIYYGSSTGLAASPSSQIDDANQANTLLANSASSAGDVNGDGYSDIIVGANGYDDGANTNEGRAFVYNGNEFTTNKRNNIRLYNANLTTPINSTNFNIGNFGAGLFAKSFLGRNRGKLVWQTRLSYNAFSGTPITNSTLFTAQQASYTNLGLSGVELKNVITKLLGGRYTKLRARVKYNPALAITGQVYGPWRYVSNIIDANSRGVILPVELISFNAAWKEKGKTAQLEFKTDKENGVCCFDMEKSTDGFNFSTIGTIPAKNTSGIQTYNFIDNNAVNKKQFYRIKIKAINGNIDYSNIQQLQNGGSTEILVFPNPTADALQLQLNNNYGKMNVQVINAGGQVVMQFRNLSATNQTLLLPVNDLSAGQYWLRIQSGGENQVLQFVKQ